MASPEFHHWHHANQREAYDRNFSGQLPLWDIVFGTLHMPRGRMPERYGTDDPVPPTYMGQLAYPLRAGEPAPDVLPPGPGDEDRARGLPAGSGAIRG